MNYTQAAAEKSTVKITMTFSNEEWAEANNQAYIKTRGKYAVPGFRKGKAPKPVLENYYGKGVFFDEAVNVLYSRHYPEILEKEKDNFTAVGIPELSLEEMTDEKISFALLVPVKPDVQIGAYKGLDVKAYEYSVTEEEINKEVEKILDREAQAVEVTDRACANGDTVNIDFSGKVDGEIFAGGTADDYDLVLGSGSFIPGFEEQVEGMKLGETKDINVNFPADYQAENLRGKLAVFTIKLNKITGKQLPELNDEYVKKHAGCESVADYKAKVKQRLEKQAENRGRDETENSIIDAICATAKCEIPQAMIESEIDGMVENFSNRLAYQGLKLEDYIKYMGQTMQEFRSQFQSQSEKRVLSQLVIEKIIREEKISADEKEVEAKVAEQAESVGKTAEEYKKTIVPRQVEYITNDIIITKLFDFLKANNNLTK